MIYVLSYPVFEPRVAERIDAFRAEHEPIRAKLVPPHITLVFGVADVHLGAVSSMVDLVSGQTHAFPVVFDRTEIVFDPFERKHKLFLQCGDGGERITGLHKQLYDGPHRDELSSDHPFDPHMTVASYDDRSALAQVDVSGLGGLPMRAMLPALELVRFEGGCLTPLKTVPFGG